MHVQYTNLLCLFGMSTQLHY